MQPQIAFLISVLLSFVAWSSMAARHFIPTVLVPLLLVTHALVFRILLQQRSHTGAAASREPQGDAFLGARDPREATHTVTDPRR